ncbi:hypothetical protein F0U44_00470 [Nocardioides humilatus]|uniref:Mce-associated membrane protein n=1 Tax=Nocardioides humilatus TaxID=2607660 RepID=A0A5B1LJH5_9ACTN|nr:hypothetical protein [Nocardioides humilatus]KAA1420861.1 hypothetical protein F0U44_00470 [Nocardioides humilatus]
MTLAGCSGDDDAKQPDEKTSSSNTTVTEHAGIDTRVEVGDVVGKLDKAAASEVAAEVATAVDQWIDAAYVGGDYPRASFADAFASFTDDAAKIATKQKDLMSNAALGDKLDEVTAVRRVVSVDLLAPKGETAGATAHVNLVIDLEGDVDRTDQVRGRLVLTPTKKGWRIFGFDIARGEVRD